MQTGIFLMQMRITACSHLQDPKSRLDRMFHVHYVSAQLFMKKLFLSKKGFTIF